MGKNARCMFTRRHKGGECVVNTRVLLTQKLKVGMTATTGIIAIHKGKCIIRVTTYTIVWFTAKQQLLKTIKRGIVSVNFPAFENVQK
jgi:hypothetical protein